MDGNFNIIDYLSGLTGFVFDKAVLQRIALERRANLVTDFEQLSIEQKDLMLADLLYTVCISPNSSASLTMQHGSYTKTIGSQTLNDTDRIYNIMLGIYKKYEDPKLVDLIDYTNGYLTWME